MYNSIKLNGNQTNSYVLIEKKDSTVTQDYEEPTWQSNTMLLASYASENLSASNLDTSESIASYRIYRLQDEKLIFVAEVDYDTSKLYDFGVNNNTIVSYYCFPVLSSGQVLNPLVTNSVVYSSDYWTVIGIKTTDENGTCVVDENNIWNFGINIEPSASNLEMNINSQNTYGRFAKIVIGQQRYNKGGISCWLGNINHSSNTEHYEDSVGLMDKWEEFVHDGKVKLLKDLKGRTFPIQIIDSNFQYESLISSQPVKVSFTYQQVGDAKDYRFFSSDIV